MINQRIVLTVTSGRSGTGYLAKILGMHPSIACFHEAEPSFEHLLRDTQSNPNIARKFWIEEKIPFIKKIGSEVYIETSHLTCKGFFEPLFELGITPDIIVLQRPSRLISKSLLQLNTIPGRTEKALKFYLSPDDPVLLPFPDWEKFNDYQLCFWYTLEILMRQKYYSTLIKNMGGSVIYTSVDELQRVESVEKLFDGLGLSKPTFKATMRLKKTIKNRVNTKDEVKSKIKYDDVELYNFEKEVYQKTMFFDRY